MRYANIIYNDVVNTDGVALCFYTQGCPHHCNGCFSKQTWDFDGGFELTDQIISEITYCLKNYKYDYLCLIGGEPLANIEVSEFIIKLCKKYQPQIKLWCYTGYTLETIPTKSRHILNYIDVLVDGQFVEELKDLKLNWMGSYNQKIYKKTESGLWYEYK